jgi:hypothetical protein
VADVVTKKKTPSTAFLSYVNGLPVSSSAQSSYSVLELAADLSSLASSNSRSNRIFVPTLNTIATLVESGALTSIAEQPEGQKM